MFQKQFAEKLPSILKNDSTVIGLAVGGSWLTGEMDEYSDLDLILVTEEKIVPDKKKMLAYAKKFGNFISGFTGEHVGEPRLLICLFDDPLIHVDIKFLTLPELEERIEDPYILFERDNRLTDLIKKTNAIKHPPGFQWIEDRFWTWVHYVATKIGRGEYFDAMSGLDYLRVHVLSHLMKFKNNIKLGGIRRVEFQLAAPDLENLKITVAEHEKESLCKAMDNTISIYRSLRRKLYPDSISLQSLAEKKSIEYFKKIKNKD